MDTMNADAAADRPATAIADARDTARTFQAVASDEVDAAHRRVVDADEALQAPHETRFRSRAAAYVCTAQDPEGNLWAFGTYRGPSPE
ncbi:VOC family protein [Streptomyces bacillaris]